MAVSFVDKTEANSGTTSAGSYNLNYPATMAAFDLGILVVSQERTTLCTTPAGWTEIQVLDGGGTMAGGIYYRRIQDTDIPGQHVHLAWGSSRRSSAVLLIYRNAADPVTALAAFTNIDSSHNSLTTPTATPAANNSWLVAVNSAIVYTSPFIKTATASAGWAERTDISSQAPSSSNGHTYAAEKILVGNAGVAQTGCTITWSGNSEQCLPATIVLAPGGPTGDAGADQTAIEPNSTVTLAALSGTGTWTQLSGTAVSLVGSGNTVTFVAPATTAGDTLLFDFGNDTMTCTVLGVTERLAATTEVVAECTTDTT